MPELQGAHLFQANLQGADLWGAKLQGAKLNNAHLEGAVVADFDPLRTQLDENTILPDGSKYDPAQGLEQLKRFGVTVAESEGDWMAWHKAHRNKD